MRRHRCDSGHPAIAVDLDQLFPSTPWGVDEQANASPKSAAEQINRRGYLSERIGAIAQPPRVFLLRQGCAIRVGLSTIVRQQTIALGEALGAVLPAIGARASRVRRDSNPT
jgi:hypothetical protein